LGTTLKVDTQEHHPEIQQRGIIWVDVVGTQRSETKNVNDAEVDKSIALAKEIAQKYPNVSIGIISPFRHQAEEINKKLPAEYRDRIVVDTVHKFQGDERDVIIYTLVVTNNSPQSKIQWIDRQVPYLVNVAVTRARSALYVVGNRQYIKTYSNRTLPLGYLAEYTENESYVINANGRETIIFDTNVFIDYPNILCRIDESKQIVVPAKVVDELDKLKVTLDDAGRRNAAIALKNINAMSNRIRRELADTTRLPIDFNRYNSDNMILSVAVKFRNQNPILITSDNGLQVKAKTLGIETKRPSEIFNAS
jgi:rRNA-processing protein FCF1